jgi:exodeoxyribonuclease VII large subunit
MEAHKLSEVNKYIKEVIALNFEDSLWIVAEISQIKSSGKHMYLDLIEKDQQNEEIVANASAVIWFRSKLSIWNKYKELADQILADGNQVQLKVQIEFHPKYGLKFIIIDIDPSYTFGKLEIQRQETIDKLKKEDLIGRNGLISLPRVIQNIAIISSEKAAGYQDFIMQLTNNPYGYVFQTSLFQSAVQGNKLVDEIIANLNKIAESDPPFDCVVIIRGGGSKLDLSGFDDYLLAKSVALYKLPVITGIGHDIDQNVIELVAHSPLKTPTAAANFILDHHLDFEGSVVELFELVYKNANQQIHALSNSTEHLFSELKHHAFRSFHFYDNGLEQTTMRIGFRGNAVVQLLNNELSKTGQKITLTNPLEILKKGYSLTFQNGKPVNELKQLKLEQAFEILFQDGSLEAQAKK